jgi:NADPH:quinone reductase
LLVIEIQNAGGPDVLRAVERPVPGPAPGEVLIAQRAIGVNFVDLQHRQGAPYPALPLPFVPGIEAAGIVAKVGPGPSFFRVGDRVAYAGPMPGAYAEYAVIAGDLVVRVPDGVSFVQAATVLMQGMTAHYLAHDAHRIQRGEWVLVHAAASGVGRFLLAYAKSLGAQVIGTSRSLQRQAAIMAAGADHALSPDDLNFAAQVMARTSGCHVVYDGLGGPHFLEALKCLRTRGDLVSYGLASGPVPAFDVARLAGYYDADINGSLRISRTSLGDFVPNVAALRKRAAAVFADTAVGLLAPEPAICLPLTQAQAAHEAFAGGADRKLVLIPTEQVDP